MLRANFIGGPRRTALSFAGRPASALGLSRSTTKSAASSYVADAYLTAEGAGAVALGSATTLILMVAAKTSP